MAEDRRRTRFEPVADVEPRRAEALPRPRPGEVEETAVLPQPVEREVHQAARPKPERLFDAGRLWAGGVATALVAGLISVVGILVARGLLGVPVLAPQGEGAWGNASTMTYCVACAVVALGATGLAQVLLATTPNGARFFGWIMVLLTAIAVVLPLSVDFDPESKVFTAVLNLVIGLVVTVLVRGVVTSAQRAVVTGRRDWR
ncbi:DUF6069 family protein [Actinosynnema mirum]|uniref:Uncharacterized protein n=1 Tax=Actinosynnema mirum (strain ATCC 29888 / DSM 43827 / JCM 3225 / NBRC 14064 / NCIMB 13271 / NRRL B-12336 / IMRU 3971 / 101) TaxID=446462 RepID=C6WJV9_ACTMD|nr:hypothetical protein Amir_2394 [Actinosynnema mirum DSM 43827]AXX29786.1 hypothetical protein APASM_2421 [Actinosynnema pretiosum subsp. pretiosum]